MRITSQYDLHRIPIGSLITYKDKYEDKIVSGNLLEILPNTGQYKLHRNDFIWTHYIQWDKYEYSYDEPDADYKQPDDIEIETSNLVAKTKNQKRNEKKRKKRKKKKKQKNKTEYNQNATETIIINKPAKTSKEKTITSFENQEGDLVVNID